ncbi:uncharacterized protein LOC134243390 [Saccostrea cucullata]|uniref:uncharacterized protein LOC134243390 n=1 Tax=Saccostrea cuccullata TaxID=36930 RepID=UPI002ED447EE
MSPSNALIPIAIVIFVQHNYAQFTKNSAQDSMSPNVDTSSIQQLVLSNVTRSIKNDTRDSKSSTIERPFVKKILSNQGTRMTNNAIEDLNYLRRDTPTIQSLLKNQETRNRNNATENSKSVNESPSSILYLLNQETLKRIQLENNLQSVQKDLSVLKKENIRIRQELLKSMRDHTEKLTDFKLYVNESIASIKSNELLDKNFANARANFTDVSDQIAFEARITSVLEFKGNQGSVVLFDQVLLNDGNGYNSSTGIFIAPRDGLYVFGWHILPGYQSISHTGLIVNNNEISGNYCNTRRNTGQQLCSKMSVVKLAVGDKVWIGYPRPGDNRAKSYFSSFCGFKL